MRANGSRLAYWNRERGGAQIQQNMERETGIGPATNSLEGCDSTTELLPLILSYVYDSSKFTTAFQAPGSVFACSYLKMCWLKRYKLLSHSVVSWAFPSTCQMCGTPFSLR